MFFKSNLLSEDSKAMMLICSNLVTGQNERVNACERNKYIYSLSQFAIAVSSDYNNGGTWAGAYENLKNNWAPMFVRKEDDVPKGNIELIKLGGIPLSKDEILNKKLTIEDWLSKE